ncbi:MAG: NAD-dependent epimerase/dehydratase family protein [Pelagimonas sp.]|uniref:NAD-dependent epimerase/dehydratase family protein n=1 Tax=Pelagimonas sp. TaxID=2073170 RepID=UPI003D6BD80C
MSARVVITGAAGFLGQAVVRLMLADPRVSHVTASDLTPCGMSHPALTDLPGRLTDPALLAEVARADVVLHLAAILGGAAEADPSAARQVNLDATFGLIEACQRGARFVFASSIAVLGETSADRAPTMVYGAHKAMVEVAIETATRRGEIDGISLRPGGIVARRDQNTGLKSAFLSQVFWAVAEGVDYELPVSQEAQTWLSSVHNVAAQFSQAALAASLGPARSLTLPMQKCQFKALVEALKARFPSSRSTVTFVPEAETMRLFGQAQPLDFTLARAAGFTPDADLAALICAALYNGETI